MFTKNWSCEMVLFYEQNKRETARQHAMKFPDHTQPHSNTITKIVKRFREKGIFNEHDRLSWFTGSTVPTVDVLGYILPHPQCSVRHIRRGLDIHYVNYGNFKQICFISISTILGQKLASGEKIIVLISVILFLTNLMKGYPL